MASDMETSDDEERTSRTGAASTSQNQPGSAANADDAEFDRILGGDTDDDENNDDSDSGIEDPTAALKNQVDRERRKRAHESSQATTRKVRKVVVGQKLPSQSSGLSRSIRNFIKFMMGMPASVSSYPAGPTSTEWGIWHNWTKNRYDKVTAHLEIFSEKHKEVPKPTFKKMYREELDRIRKKLTPPPFIATPDVLNSEINIPMHVKKSCEQEIQIAGFGRLTFEWKARSFTTSPWNGTLGTILMKHYYQWAKSQPGTFWDETSSMEKILDRWVQGQGKLMKKADRSDGKSLEDLKIEKSRKATINQGKTKIAEKRRDVAMKKMGNQPSLALLFTKETISDWEDQPSPAKPKRIVLQWRSPAFTACSLKLDEMALTICKTTAERASIRKLLERDPVAITNVPVEFEAVPRKLPIDAYDSTFLSGLSPVEKEHLDMGDAIDLDSKVQTLNEMTLRGRGGAGIPLISRGNVGGLGVGGVQGPSSGT
ncbi:uncharacterized protein PGTG_18932 [Puccinia graminis f. sp. tritici CRL 75-36-700-3]|uniref:Uncharacterized protein n=1 Tax=Puccinia graminis f. sp. tritici (strain CRL 75-36-700-3 / race SCCL) TaxID=418459 RepID=E3LAE3_PUCGT|nr:uncharacterized protein PGTG_18932 [Puccinia graminis f. sp. tritici CRL 75-36-700-3]EFP93518.2 hypothetical protein PGTG_18932 [Puccinia graminis f. sp. tritici CRL 75-36-700-3]